MKIAITNATLEAAKYAAELNAKDRDFEERTYAVSHRFAHDNGLSYMGESQAFGISRKWEDNLHGARGTTVRTSPARYRKSNPYGRENEGR